MTSRVVDLGCGDRPDPRATLGLDWYPGDHVDLRGSVLALPFKDGSIDELIAHQVVEHLPVAGIAGRDPFYRFFDECWRVLRPGGILRVDVPHADSPSAYDDATHRRFLTEKAFEPLWDSARDPHYPRRIWTEAAVRTTSHYPILHRVRSRYEVVNRALRGLMLGCPSVIFVALRKASS